MRKTWRLCQCKTHKASVAINSSELDPNRKFRCFVIKHVVTHTAQLNACSLGLRMGRFSRPEDLSVYTASHEAYDGGVHGNIKYIKL
jgi:hypothetical protein